MLFYYHSGGRAGGLPPLEGWRTGLPCHCMCCCSRRSVVWLSSPPHLQTPTQQTITAHKNYNFLRMASSHIRRTSCSVDQDVNLIYLYSNLFTCVYPIYQQLNSLLLLFHLSKLYFLTMTPSVLKAFCFVKLKSVSLLTDCLYVLPPLKWQVTWIGHCI